MRSHHLLVASLAAALLSASPALACRVPIGHPELSVVMSNPPQSIPEGATVIHGRFLNAGPEFDRFSAELPMIPGEPVTLPDSQIELSGDMFDRYLIGVLVSDTGDATPIYDGNCSDAIPESVRRIDQRAWIVGWLSDVSDVRAFTLAPRNGVGGWRIYQHPDKPLGNPRVTR